MTGDKLCVSIHELEEGQSTGPYHFDYGNEEWAIVLEGCPLLRDPDGERLLEPGDVVCFARGPAGAHELRHAGAAHGLRNAGTPPVRVLIVTTMLKPSVTVYPDDDTLEVIPPGRVFRLTDALTRLDES